MDDKSKTHEPSTFVGGMLSKSSDYVLTVMTNAPGIRAILKRDKDFINGLIDKIIFGSNKIDDGRDRWSGHNFHGRYGLEVKAMIGWPYNLTVSLSERSMDALAKDDPQTVEFFANKLVTEVEYLLRKFPLKMEADFSMSAVEIQAEAVPDVPAVDTPKPKRVRKTAEPKAETDKPKRASRAKAKPAEVTAPETAETQTA